MNKEKNKINLDPIRFIKIAKDMSSKEMAEYFGVTSAYISNITASELSPNKRNMSKRVLLYGLERLGIFYSDYLELEAFSYEISNKEISDNRKFRYMLIKAIGTVCPELKEESEKILNTYYQDEECYIMQKEIVESNPVRKRVRLVDGKLLYK